MTRLVEQIAAIITRKAKEGIPFHRYSWEPAQSYLAPSVEEIARAIFLEAVEPALVRAQPVSDPKYHAPVRQSDREDALSLEILMANALLNRLRSGIREMHRNGMFDTRRMTLRVHPITLQRALPARYNAVQLENVMGFPVVEDDTMMEGDITLRFEVAV